MNSSSRSAATTFRFLAEPGDANVMGKVHGGVVMKWIDQAGYACAVGWSGRPCVTVFVGGIRFYKPILIGHLVEVHARVIHVGHTSIHVALHVRSADIKTRVFEPTTHCVSVFVAVDEGGQPAAAPPWTPASEADKAWQRYARRLMEVGKQMEQEMRPHLVPESATGAAASKEAP